MATVRDGNFGEKQVSERVRYAAGGNFLRSQDDVGAAERAQCGSGRCSAAVLLKYTLVSFR